MSIVDSRVLCARRWILTLLITPFLIVMGAPNGSALPLVNGDFQTGDLTGWSTFTTANGVIGTAAVVPFATTNGGPVTDAARFNVGEAVSDGDGNTFAGGGILQNVSLGGAGLVNITANLASRKAPKPGLIGPDDNHGGLFDLLIDNIVRTSFDFGVVAANQTHYGVLSLLNFAITGGSHEIRIRITRPWANDAATPTTSPSPREYIDDVTLSMNAVPEPHTFALFVSGMLGLAILRRRN